MIFLILIPFLFGALRGGEPTEARSFRTVNTNKKSK